MKTKRVPLIVSKEHHKRATKERNGENFRPCFDCLLGQAIHDQLGVRAECFYGSIGWPNGQDTYLGRDLDKLQRDFVYHYPPEYGVYRLDVPIEYTRK